MASTVAGLFSPEVWPCPCLTVQCQGQAGVSIKGALMELIQQQCNNTLHTPKGGRGVGTNKGDKHGMKVGIEGQ